MTEVLVANLVFLLNCPKRRLFALRLPLAFFACGLFAYFFDVSLLFKDFVLVYQLFQFIQFFLLFLVGFFGMLVCFNISLSSCFALCSAGYACQHIGSRLFLLGKTIFSMIFEIDLGGNNYYVDATDSDAVLFLYNCFIEFIVSMISYIVIYVLFGRKVKEQKFYEKSSPIFNLLAIIMVLVCIGLNRFSDGSNSLSTIGMALYSITCCVFALIVMFNLHNAVTLKEENIVMHKLLLEGQKQYESTKKSIDIINLKCHDLKHKLSAYASVLPDDEIASMKKSIEIYDSSIKTGNSVLDIIITEKNLICSSYGIKFTCLGNGNLLSFINTADLYALFGNAIDNAIDAVKDLTEEGKRLISINIDEKGDYVLIYFINYYEGSLQMERGLPLTTKTTDQGYHGFGLKSIRLIASKYKGSILVSAKDGIFNLCVSLDRNKD